MKHHIQKQMMALDRVLRVVDDGALYEPDPRHIEMLARDMGLASSISKGAATPGAKPKLDEDQHVDKEDSLENSNHIRDAKPRCMHVSFVDNSLAETIGHAAPPCVPRDHLLTGKLGSLDSIPVPRGHDRFTGLTRAEITSLRSKLPDPGKRRSAVLRRYPSDGAAWEIQISD